MAVGDEHEQVLAEALDGTLQLEPGPAGRDDLEQAVEVALEPGVVGRQGGVGQCRATPAAVDGAPQQGLEARGEGVVAAVDGISGVA
ncbi:MAG: hypothetical protein RLO23_02750 [Alphaproteobacteria bacterium]